MNSWMDWCLLGLTAFNDVILSLFCCSLLTSSCKWLHTLLFAVSAPVLLVSLDVLGIADITAGNPLRSAIAISYMCGFTILIFKDTITKKLLILALGWFLGMFAQIMVALPLAMNGFFDFSSVYTERNGYFLLAMAGTSVCYGTCCCLAAYLIKYRKFAGSSFKLLSCFIVIQSLLFNTASLKAFWDQSIKGLSEWFVLLAVCIAADAAAFYLIREMDRKIRLEAETEFYKKQLSMQLDLYRNFSAYTDGLQQVRRRLTRELSQVCTALDRGDYNRVFDRSQHLQGDLENLKLSGCCKNSLLNAVLFMKQREMEVQEISFEPMVQLEEEIFVKRSDLCRIVSNLLDNAMEACAAVSVQSRLIRFTCMPVKHALLIKTVNSFSGSRKPDETGLLRSTKKEPGHGYGLSSVKEIMAPYQGVLNVELDEAQELACVTVTLFER